MTALVLAAVMAWAGWAWLLGIPLAFALSQIPAVVWLLAWAADHPVPLSWPARSRPTGASPAALAVEAAEQVLVAAVVDLDEHREEKRAA